MQTELLVYRIEEYLNKNFLIEKMNSKNKLKNSLSQKPKKTGLDDKEQKKVN